MKKDKINLILSWTAETNCLLNSRGFYLRQLTASTVFCSSLPILRGDPAQLFLHGSQTIGSLKILDPANSGSAK